ncbi:UNVERIFIED_CONTAM: hypothetical protein NCL1_57994, partial [Trichonephila clavipes]
MSNGSHTTILCKNDRGQSAVKQLKPWPNQDRRPGRFYCIFVSFRTKFRSLLSTTGPFEASIFDVKDAPRIGRPVVDNVDKITETIEVDRP